MNPLSAIAILTFSSASLAPKITISLFGTDPHVPSVQSKPAVISSAREENQAADSKNQAGEDLPVPPAVQSFIDAYQAGKIRAALAVIFDPWMRLLNEGPAKSSEEIENREKAQDAFAILRGAMRTRMTGPKEDAGPPQEIQVLRCFKVAKEKARVDIKVRHASYTYYIKFITQKTPIGEIIVNVSLGGTDILDE